MTEDIDKLDGFDKFKLFVATLVFLGGGGFLAWGPTEKIHDEFAYFREIGYGLLAFGGIFALVLITEGSASAGARELNFRLKSLMAMIVGGVLAGVVVFAFAPEVFDCWKLARNGKAVPGKIVNRKFRIGYKNKRISQIQIEYDGHRKWIDGSGSGHYPVVYMPDEPDTMHKGTADDGFFQMLNHGTGTWVTLGLSVVGFFFAVFALAKAKHFFFGRSDSA